MQERIQKIIARSGRCSRREAEQLISAGLVTVNGRVARLGERADADHDAIKVEGKLLRTAEKKRYILLNKPRGFVTTASDTEGRATVLELLGRQVRERVYPVGRLDLQTEGLLVLTNDGDFALKIAHPSYGCLKEYEVKVSGELLDKQLTRLVRGVTIEGDRLSAESVEFMRRTKARKPDDESNAWYRIVIREGKNHHVRRLFDAIGHPVLKLKRVAIGPLRDPKLPRGTWRDLTPREIHAVLRLSS